MGYHRSMETLQADKLPPPPKKKTPKPLSTKEELLDYKLKTQQTISAVYVIMLESHKCIKLKIHVYCTETEYAVVQLLLLVL